MRRSALIAEVALLLAMLPPLAAQAAPPVPPTRWVQVDDLRVRAGPDPEQRVVGTLSRGAQVVLKGASTDGFCLVEGDEQYGYVACNFLSAERIARPRAGENGIDPAQRWVSGNSVVLREAPRPDAAVVGRFPLNAVVKLVHQPAGSAYCEVQPATGPSGYTACRYLAPTPVVLADIRGHLGAGQAPSPNYDPERAFWLEPSWNALTQYAEHLKQRHPDIPPQGPWPRDEALERMKAHLALGLKGSKPPPYADWLQLKGKAAQDLDLSGEARRLRAQRKPLPEELSRREGQTQGVASELQPSIGIWGPLHDAISAEGGAERIVQLVRALEFPAIQPSLFRSEEEVAAPRTNAEEASGRFGIVFRQLTTPRPKPEAEIGPGFYDMLTRTQLLVRPVQRVRLFRDGRLGIDKSHIRSRETLWYEVDEPECAGWIPGFAFGDADAPIWRYFDLESPGADSGRKSRQASLNRNPAGSLFTFYANIDVPAGPALRTEIPMKLNRGHTGFAQGTYLLYDLDRDRVPDIAIWEGQGKGPGHLENQTTTDDRWYRLVLVNINGAWKVLGSDIFGYGCGC